MKQVFTAAVLAFALLAGAAGWAGEPRPIVVELFTSQGCSSCPPADALLAKLAQRKGLIAVSLPITYWDMLGWKDTLASEADTRRQKAYAAAMGHGGVYTPQMVIDGVKDVVGSREDAVEQAIDEAIAARDDAMAAEGAEGNAAPPAARAWSVGVDLVGKPQALRVSVAAAPGVARKSKLDATVWLLRLRSSATVKIGAGENGGRTMTYRNVVNDIREVGQWRGTALSLDLPRADAKTPAHDGVVVIVQQGGYGRVVGAAYLGHADYYAQE